MSNEIIEEEERIAEERALAEMRLAMAGLHRPVGELPTLAAALTCERSATVRQAIEAMQRARTGCLLILDQGHLVGIFTERDVLYKVAAQEVDLDQLRVGALMTPQPESLHVDDDLVYALNQMSVGGYRYIPLLDDQGRPTQGPAIARPCPRRPDRKTPLAVVTYYAQAREIAKSRCK